jgi:glycosyltransferase involved in cell wall biosynthesis
MAREGALAETLHIITPERLVALGKAARKRAERVFSREVVIRQYVDYYRRVSSV